MTRMRGEASLRLSCYMIGLRLSQIARLRLRMGCDQSRDTILALRALISSLTTAIQKLASLTSLETTSFAKFTRRNGYHRQLNPLLYEDAEQFAESIFREFCEVIDQLFPANETRADILRGWGKLGWEIPFFDECQDESVVWHHPEELDSLLFRTGMELKDLFASRSETLPPGWEITPEVAESVIGEWWRIEDGLRKLNFTLQQEWKPTGDSNVKQDASFGFPLNQRISSRSVADGSNSPRHADSKTKQVDGFSVTQEPSLQIHAKKKQKNKPSREPKKIENWVKVGIGIDAQGSSFFLFEKCPADGELVEVSNATASFAKRKGQLSKVISHLADSEDGRSISVREIFNILRYGSRQRGTTNGGAILFEPGMQTKQSKDRIRSAMAGLGREMRRIASDSTSTQTFAINGENYISVFKVRNLMPDGDNRLRFGKRRSQED